MTTEEDFKKDFPSLKGKEEETQNKIGKVFDLILETRYNVYPEKDIQKNCIDKANIHKLPDDQEYLIMLPIEMQGQLNKMAHLIGEMTKFRKHKILLINQGSSFGIKIEKVKEVIDKEIKDIGNITLEDAEDYIEADKLKILERIKKGLGLE